MEGVAEDARPEDVGEEQLQKCRRCEAGHQESAERNADAEREQGPSCQEGEQDCHQRRQQSGAVAELDLGHLAVRADES